MTESEPQQTPKLALIIGVAALVGGLWLLLNAQGVGVPPFKKLWPLLFLVAGAASFADYLFLSRHPRAAGWSLAWIGFGVLGFALTNSKGAVRGLWHWVVELPAASVAVR